MADDLRLPLDDELEAVLEQVRDRPPGRTGL